jgi:hypothetical protein
MTLPYIIERFHRAKHPSFDFYSVSIYSYRAYEIFFQLFSIL